MARHLNVRLQALHPRQKALRLQKKIFNSLKAEADLLLGKMPESIRRYEKEYQRDFKSLSRLCTISKPELIEAVQKAKVTFVADFHTFDQAQRTALRIIREVIQPGKLWLIGLELVSSQFQDQLDAFQAGNMSVEEFHEAISYEQTWGFPWQNYSPLFEWARENQIRLIALNRPSPSNASTSNQDLDQRDAWAADRMIQQFQENPEAQMIVLYGDLHVGTRHLPKQLDRASQQAFKKRLSWITIHQNEDSLYWRLAKENRELHSDIIKIRKNVYCVLSSTPWTKLQSLVSWTEGSSSERTEFDRVESDVEMDLDYLSLMRTYGNTIADFLGLPPPSFAEINVLQIDQTETLDSLVSPELFSSLEMRLIEFHINHNQRIYIPKLSLAYLGSPSQNGAAELASIHLLKTHTGCNRLFNGQRDDFFRLILESAFGFFGSLILNPRRKCDLLKDHQQRVEALLEGEKAAFPLEKESRELVIAALEDRLFESPHLKRKILLRRLARATVVAAKYLGRILGKSFHQEILSKNANSNLAREIFLCPDPEVQRLQGIEESSNSPSSPNSPSSYEARYERLIEATSQIKHPPTKRVSF